MPRRKPSRRTARASTDDERKVRRRPAAQAEWRSGRERRCAGRSSRRRLRRSAMSIPEPSAGRAGEHRTRSRLHRQSGEAMVSSSCSSRGRPQRRVASENSPHRRDAALGQPKPGRGPVNWNERLSLESRATCSGRMNDGVKSRVAAGYQIGEAMDSGPRPSAAARSESRLIRLSQPGDTVPTCSSVGSSTASA